MAKKVSLDTLKKANRKFSNEEKISLGELNGKEIEVSVKRYISAEEIVKLTQEMIELCFIEDTYEPLTFEISMPIKLIKLYTNINIPDENLETYDLIKKLDILNQMEQITYHHNVVYDLVLSAIEEVKERKQYSKSISGMLNELFVKFNSVLDNLNTEKLLTLTESIKDIPVEAVHLKNFLDLKSASPNDLKSLEDVINTKGDENGKEVSKP